MYSNEIELIYATAVAHDVRRRSERWRGGEVGEYVWVL
jgi:hypothetical protein